MILEGVDCVFGNLDGLIFVILIGDNGWFYVYEWFKVGDFGFLVIGSIFIGLDIGIYCVIVIDNVLGC